MTALRIGVDVGGTKVLGVLFDADARSIVAQHRAPTPTSVDELVETIAGVVDEIAAEHRESPVGLGLPGLVDVDGVLRAAPNLRFAIDQPVVHLLEQRSGRRVVVDNDANCALRAELAVGDIDDGSSVVLVALGTGIGGAIALDGSIVRGANGFAGEFGHIQVDPDGPLCPCGRRGCWERFASGAGLAHLAALRGHGDVDGPAITAAARAGEAWALEVWNDLATWLAIGLADLADVLDPGLFVIGGGLVDEVDLFLDAARTRFTGEVLGGRARTRTRIVAATAGSDSGAVGAALLR